MKTEEELKGILANPDQTLYQPLEHPDFIDRKSQQPCLERWHYIQSTGLASTGFCIDIGCHTGWFCRKFSHLGWRTLGIDKKETEIEIARDLMYSFNGPIEPVYARKDISDIELPPSDIILCLSFVMYLFNPRFGKTEEEAWSILEKISLSSPKMFLDYGGQYSTISKEFPEDVVRRTYYDHFRLLGHTDLESRPFYLFERVS